MSQLTEEQVLEWQAYETLEPMGTKESTFMVATLCSTVVNIMIGAFGGKGPQSKTFTPFDFMPDWDPKPKKDVKKDEDVFKAETVADMKALFKQMADSFAKRKKRENRRPPNEHR